MRKYQKKEYKKGNYKKKSQKLVRNYLTKKEKIATRGERKRNLEIAETKSNLWKLKAKEKK